MIAQILLAAAVALAPQAEPAPPPFEPFYVGPAYPPDQLGVLHIVVYADTPEEGQSRCLDELYWAGPGPVDCMTAPRSVAPDPTQPGWALPYGPGGDR